MWCKIVNELYVCVCVCVSVCVYKVILKSYSSDVIKFLKTYMYLEKVPRR
jgi:hypothetical protein